MVVVAQRHPARAVCGCFWGSGSLSCRELWTWNIALIGLDILHTALGERIGSRSVDMRVPPVFAWFPTIGRCLSLTTIV